MIGGFLLVLLSGVATGALGHTGTDNDLGPAYDQTRGLLFAIVPWAAVGFVLWNAGRVPLFAVATVIVIAGLAAGWFGLGDLDAGGSGESKADIGLVVGSIGALVGMFIAWAGARLVWPSTSNGALAQNSPPTSRGATCSN